MARIGGSFARLAGPPRTCYALAMADDLIEQYRIWHDARPRGLAFKPMWLDLFSRIRLMRPAPMSVLDYGCGRSRFVEEIDVPSLVRRDRYDPAISEFSTPPSGRYDLLASNAVLEHIPEAEIPATLATMRALSDRCILVIGIAPAKLILADGRNAHVTVRPPDWWRDRLLEHFPIAEQFPLSSPRLVAFQTWPAPNALRLAISAAVTRARYKLRRRRAARAEPTPVNDLTRRQR